MLLTTDIGLLEVDAIPAGKETQHPCPVQRTHLCAAPMKGLRNGKGGPCSCYDGSNSVVASCGGGLLSVPQPPGSLDNDDDDEHTRKTSYA